MPDIRALATTKAVTTVLTGLILVVGSIDPSTSLAGRYRWSKKHFEGLEKDSQRYCSMSYEQVTRYYDPVHPYAHNGPNASKMHLIFFGSNKDIVVYRQDTVSSLTAKIRHACSSEVLRKRFRDEAIYNSGKFSIATCYLGKDRRSKKMLSAMRYDYSWENNKNIANWKNNCVDYFNNSYLITTLASLRARKENAILAREKARQARAQAQLAREKARKAEIAKKQAQEEAAHLAELNKQKAIAQHRQSRTMQLSALVVADNKRIVWGNEKHTSATVPQQSTNMIFNKINAQYQSEIVVNKDESKFEPPKKGEFEKSADYKARVERLRQEHSQELAKQREALRNNRTKILERILNDKLGSPRMSSLQYNADKEQFHFKISSSAGYRIDGYVKTPIAKAPADKALLANMTPWVVLKFEGNKLVPVGAILESNDDIRSNITLHGGAIDVAFTTEQDKLYEQKQAQAEQQRAQAERQHAREYAARRARERAAWPRGAVAKIRNGAFLCATYQSAFKSMILERANNPYVSRPGDCLVLPQTGYADSVRHINGQVFNVHLLGATRSGYTASYFVEE